MDISTLSIPQLKELLAVIPGEIARRQAEEKQKVLEQMAALANSHGFSLEELVNGKAGGKKGASKMAGTKVAAKYRHPTQSDVTWSGRGRKPVWVNEWLNSGKSLEELAV